jgi:hypothetical protein
MKMYHMKRVTLGNSRGGVLVLVAMLLVVFISIAALAIDIGQLSTTRNELQNVADAAALAGAAKLGSIYKDELTPAEVPGHEFQRSDVVPVVQAVALQNKASGLNVVIYDTATDIRIGKWNPAIKDIAPETLIESDAVYVKVRRDDNDSASPTRQITTFFAGIFGIDTLSVTAEAAAALSGPSSVAEGELQLPVGISENVFIDPPGQYCSDLIAFSPTPSSCAAWHNFEDDINGDAMEDKIIGIIEGHTVKPDDCTACGTLDSGLDWMETNFSVKHNPQYPGALVTPSYSKGAFFNFQGGQISKLLSPGSSYLVPDDPDTTDDDLGNYDSGNNPGNEGIITGQSNNPQDMTALFDYFRYRDGDENPATWSTTIPVYKDDTEQDADPGADCDNATGSREIVGFVEVTVLQTNPPPSTTLAVQVKCDLVVAEGRGGGGGFSNTLGTVPSLVK